MNPPKHAVDFLSILLHNQPEKHHQAFLLKFIDNNFSTRDPDRLTPRIIITQRIMTKVLALPKSLDDITADFKIDPTILDEIQTC